MLANVREDLAHLAEIKGLSRGRALVEGLLFENGFQAVILHRVAHWFRSRGVPFLGPLVARFALFATGADIAPKARLGPGLYVSHGVGLVIGGDVVAGRRCFFLGNVNVGAPSQSRLDEMPRLGDEVFVGAGARILGGVRIGDRAFVGANAVVAVDVPDDHKALVAKEALEVVRRGPRAVAAEPTARRPAGGGAP